MPRRKVTTRARRSTVMEDLSVGDEVRFHDRKGSGFRLATITRVRDFTLDIETRRGKALANVDRTLISLSASKVKEKEIEKDSSSDEDSEAHVSQKTRVTGPRKAKQRAKARVASRKSTSPKAKQTNAEVGFEDEEEEKVYETEEESDEVTPIKPKVKSPMHYRAEKKKQREYFTKEEVKVLMQHVFDQKGYPEWIELKIKHEKATGLFANRTTLDLKDKYRNLQLSGLAEQILNRMADDESYDDLLDKTVFTPGKRKDNFHFRSGKKKKRRPWTNEELACLTAGHNKYGSSWTKIKSIYPENLKERTTLDLKDKWRNLQWAEMRLREK